MLEQSIEITLNGFKAAIKFGKIGHFRNDVWPRLFVYCKKNSPLVFGGYTITLSICIPYLNKLARMRKMKKNVLKTERPSLGQAAL
jgi:hypothetical protein